MKIVLATGIFPPDVGGPAFYAQELAKRMIAEGQEVVVITYAPTNGSVSEDYPVVTVSREGSMLQRWRRYAAALREHASDADTVYGFSSISVGVPLRLARLKKPKKILRLGGDFFWERYTDRGGMKTLPEWYEGHFFSKWLMHRILKGFDAVIFTTKFQNDLYEKHYKQLPLHGVIENAFPDTTPTLHIAHQPLRLLYLGRFVAFKNLSALIDAMKDLPDTTLSLIGSGPMEEELREQVRANNLESRVTFLPSQYKQRKREMWDTHDLFVIPSITEISPNSALEARAAGLPVLLTKNTGLSETLKMGMFCRDLSTPEQIRESIENIRSSYDQYAQSAATPVSRTWEKILQDYAQLFFSV